MSNTPTTDARWETLCCSGQSWYQIAEEMKLDCRQRERELTAVTEQRDRMAEAIRKHRDELELTSGESVDRILWNTLAAVKENQKTDSQSCPECDALASHGYNDGPCNVHKL